MRRALVLVALLVACEGAPVGPDDAGVRRDARPPVDDPQPGGPCLTDDDCQSETLYCNIDVAGGLCTAACVDDPSSREGEEAQCGGAGSTCVSNGDPGPTQHSICTRACVPGARDEASGACRPGHVCTGHFYTHDGLRPDGPGCFPFCAEDAQCPRSEPCSARTGSCGAEDDESLERDGEPCDWRLGIAQCRGVCLPVGATPGQGMCTSFIDLRVRTECPDEPATMRPLRAERNGDDLALCIFRSCASDAECATPLRCLSGPGGAVCLYP